MTKEERILEILGKEWEMFHNVNGEERASCQNNKAMFIAMRRGQYDIWSEEVLASYEKDLDRARDEGRNIAREKYINMMKSTDPEGYEIAKRELPEYSEEKIRLTNEIWKIMGRQTAEMREKYPVVSSTGRPLYAKDEANGATSVETYQKGELLTYSEETLELLLKEIQDMEANGEAFAFAVQENSVKNLGYASLDEAEKSMKEILLRRMQQ